MWHSKLYSSSNCCVKRDQPGILGPEGTRTNLKDNDKISIMKLTPENRVKHLQYRVKLLSQLEKKHTERIKDLNERVSILERMVRRYEQPGTD